MEQMIRRIGGAAVVLVMLLSCFGFGAGDVNASVVKKIERSYDIAVVFDNSGSMYKSDAWCKAKYAMEIFAAMMPYGKNDSLRIYPMWEVTTGEGGEGSYEPIEISSSADIDKIHNMYTVTNGQTPFAPVREALEDLEGSTADEKWLIVLTDGEFNMDGRKGKTKDGIVDVQKELSDIADKGISVQYLAMGEDASALQASENKGLFAVKATNASLSQDLIVICNRIFQRALLPADAYSDNGKINLDLSMNNLIVFVQGKNAKVEGLEGSKGEVKLKDRRQCQYSDVSTGGKYANVAQVDPTLYGEVDTFGACKKGIYKLSAQNVDKKNLQIFYEPDVNIKVVLKDPNKNDDPGTELTNADGFKTGDYTIDYALIDNQTGKDVSTSNLLGKVTYDGELRYSNGETKRLDPGDPFTLKPDGEAFVYVKATYLEDYQISTDYMKDDYTIKVDKAAAKKLGVKLDVKQSGSWYNTRKHDEWKPIRAHLQYNGKDLTDEQLDNVKMKCSFEDGTMDYALKPVHGESAIDIYPGQKQDGTYAEPEKGKYKMTADASYTAQYSKASKASDHTKFHVAGYSKLLWWLMRIIPLLALLLLLLWWNLHKTFPRKVYFNDKMGASRIKIKNKGINLSSNTYPGEITCDADKVTNHMARKKKSAKFVIKNIKPDPSVQSFSIGLGKEFVKDGSGNFVDTFGKPLNSKTKITISNGTEIVWRKPGKRRRGVISINSKK